ncbi:hypothetical protein GW950_00470 [Candidatus Wolfebacteria bacterium]|nr:hypothetical protein [Candidatus Wolfebacteria bacterium]
MNIREEIKAAYKAAMEVTHLHGQKQKENTPEVTSALVEARTKLESLVEKFDKRQFVQLANRIAYMACVNGISIENDTWDAKKSIRLLNVIYSVLDAVNGTKKDGDKKGIVYELNSRQEVLKTFLRVADRVGYKPAYGFNARALKDVLKKADSDIKVRGADNQSEENREVALRLKSLTKPLRVVLGKMEKVQGERKSESHTVTYGKAFGESQVNELKESVAQGEKTEEEAPTAPKPQSRNKRGNGRKTSRTGTQK